MNEQYRQYAVAPDREFESRLKAELDARLEARQQSATDLPKENEIMIVQTEKARARRRLMLPIAASLIAVAAAGGLLAALANRDNETPAPPVVAPTTVVAPVTTVAPTTTIHQLSDTEIANAVILKNAEYDPRQFLNTYSPGAKMDAAVARRFPECAPFLDAVFESTARPAVTADAAFTRLDIVNPAQTVEYVVVHPDEAQAAAMLDAMQEPAFLGECVPAYAVTMPQTCCAEVAKSIFPVFVGTETEPPKLDVGADDIWVRAYDGTWTDDQGVVHGPEGFAWAAVRVGRVYASIEVMTTAADGSTVTTLDQFEVIVKRMVERAAAAQHGLVL